MKQWNLGNTTIRNPERIKEGLRLLSDKFAGKIFTPDIQDEYYTALHNAKIIEGDPPKAESRRESARKWAAAFNQLGLAKCWQRKPPIEITEAGQTLLSDATIDEDIYLRQLLKIQIPSPTESRMEGAAVHPFYLTLNVTHQLYKLGLKGITREEIALYLQTAITDNYADQIIAMIQKYRDKRDSLVGRVEKRRFYLENATRSMAELYREDINARLVELSMLVDAHHKDRYFLSSKEANEILKNITATGKGSMVKSAVDCRQRLTTAIENLSPKEVIEHILVSHILGRKTDTLWEYSDTTIRYSRITGLFTITGDKLAIKEDQLRLAEQILAQDKPALLDKEDFLIKFYSSQYPILPTEDAVFLAEDISLLHHKAVALEARVGIGEISPIKATDNMLTLRKQRKDLEMEILARKEIEFYKTQHNTDQINAIKDLFESIANKEIIAGSDYLPAWIEWAVWRVFLAINTIANSISDTRNFDIDTDLYPIHHAKSNVADMVFKYPQEFIMPTEVTLNTRENQYNAEREPVQRHVRRIAESTDKEVIGVFIAPTIDESTAFEFFKDRSGVYSKELRRAIPISIIPLTVKQLISFLPGELNACNNSNDLHIKLKSLLSLAERCSDGVEWLTTIRQALAI